MAVDLSCSDPGGYPLITVSGDLDRAAVAMLEGALWQSIEQLGPTIVDLTQVTFLDLGALRCLARAHAEAQAYGAAVHLIRPSIGPVALLLDVSRLCDHLPMYSDIKDVHPGQGVGRDRERFTDR